MYSLSVEHCTTVHRHDFSELDKVNMAISNYHYAPRRGESDPLSLYIHDLHNMIQGGTTPLIVASAFGYVETVNLLLCSGADVNQTNVSASTHVV